MIPLGFSVVDIGGGTGIQAVHLAGMREDLTVYVCDYNPEMLEITEERAKRAGVLSRIVPQKADMTKLAEVGLPEGSFVYSNTALHELRNRGQLNRTWEGIAKVVGTNGACYVRDLIFPETEEQAMTWREEVLGPNGDNNLSPRDLELFRNSQWAGFRLETVQKAVNRTSLRGRCEVTHLGPPSSRYWVAAAQPPGVLVG
jgi:SAM-dependent methyltransferase